MNINATFTYHSYVYASRIRGNQSSKKCKKCGHQKVKILKMWFEMAEALIIPGFTHTISSRTAFESQISMQFFLPSRACSLPPTSVSTLRTTPIAYPCHFRHLYFSSFFDPRRYFNLFQYTRPRLQSYIAHVCTSIIYRLQWCLCIFIGQDRYFHLRL